MSFTESLLSVKKKAHFQCCLCPSLGIEVHHIIPEVAEGPDTEDNAVPLCPSCHETYGANPEKRKFVREARDFWYEICVDQYASDKSLLDRIAKQTQGAVSKEDLEKAVERILGFNEVQARALSEDHPSHTVEAPSRSWRRKRESVHPRDAIGPRRIHLCCAPAATAVA